MYHHVSMGSPNLIFLRVVLTIIAFVWFLALAALMTGDHVASAVFLRSAPFQVDSVAPLSLLNASAINEPQIPLNSAPEIPLPPPDKAATAIDATTAPYQEITAPVAKPSQLISRNPNVGVTCDVRGNLGPCSVVVQDPPGTDWLKDRWQAASDMGGTAIPGRHFVVLDFQRTVVADRVHLDWETAFADSYRLEVSANGASDAEWTVLFDGTVGVVGPSPMAGQRLTTPGRATTTEGQSPGVPKGVIMPLHVLHDIELDDDARAVPFRFMRLYIVKPAVGWGVSLWQFDVFGREVG